MPNIFIKILAPLMVLSFVACPTAYGEVIKLKNGKQIEGDVIEKTGDYVTVNAQGKIWKIRFRLMNKDDAEKFSSMPLKTPQTPRQALRSIAEILSQNDSSDAAETAPEALRASSLPDRELDFNMDGNSDQWEYVSPDGLEKKVERDSDFDGIIDAVWWEYYRERDKELSLKTVYDNNNDGKIDSITYYDTEGIWMEKTLDSDGDGTLETVFTCHGKDLEKVTIDLDHDDLPDILQIYRKGRFVSAEVDTDFDGRFDRRFKDVRQFNRWFSGNYFEWIPRYLKILNSFEIRYR